MNNLILEACVETLEEAILAEQNGAHRLELCSRLDLDGLTPDFELTRQVLEETSIPIKVMIRPRGGDFVYSENEINLMKDEILRFKTLNIQGLVFGMLDSNNHLEIRQIDTLSKLSFPLKVTIHKAIDICQYPIYELEQLLKINYVTSVLTSGGSTTAMEGKKVIRKMIEASKGSLSIIAAGKINRENLKDVHAQINGNEYHGRKIVGMVQTSA